MRFDMQWCIFSLLSFLFVFSSSILVSESQPLPGPDAGVGGMVGVNATSAANWQILCKNKTPDKVVTLTISSGQFNGIPHDMVSVNGQFPGPTLEFQENDCVQVILVNQLNVMDGNYYPYNSTVHFHGQHFHGAPWSDGVPGVTQCLLPNGQSMNYYFAATAVGTSWYHGHYDGQYVSGLFGPSIVVPKQQSPYMTSAKADWVVMLSDGYTNTYKTLINFVMSPLDYTGEEPLPDFFLLNGNMDQQLAFDATKGERVLIRLINSAALTMYKFWIDGCVLQVVEIDGSAVFPYTVSEVVIGVAQRVSIIVDFSANDVSSLNAVWMHFDNSLMPTERLYRITSASISFTGASTAKYYRGRSITSSDFPTSTPAALPSTFLGSPVISVATTDWNMLDAEPLYPVAAPAPTLTIPLVLFFNFGADGIFYAYWSGVTYNQLDHHYQYPQLYQMQDTVSDGTMELPMSFFDPSSTEAEYGPTSFLYNVPHGSVIDIIINNTDTGVHPIHLHGFRYWIVDSDMNPGAVSKSSYIQRDVALAAPLGWTRFRVVADNPGSWLLHCHIDWHFEEGLGTILNVDPLSFVSNPMPAPSDHQEICAWWQAQEVAAFNTALAGNLYTPSTGNPVTAGDAALGTYVANTIICLESVFALAIYKMGIMYSILFDLVALNVGTLLGVCFVELDKEMWTKVVDGSLRYEVVSFLLCAGAMLPYIFEKFVKRGRVNKFAWLKQVTNDKANASKAANDTPKASVDGRPKAITVSSNDEIEMNKVELARSSSGLEEKEKASEDVKISIDGKPESPRLDLDAISPTAALSSTEPVSPSSAIKDDRNGDGIVLDPTQHGEYKVAKAVAMEMDVVLIIVMLAGDMLHNFVDGSIIASAFLTSNAIGLATAIGIFLEELPHLIGTFAVFMHAGAPIWKAVALSVFGAFPFLLGGTLIIGVATDTSVDRTQISYLLAFAIGSFLYITLADLVPVLTSQWNGGKRAVIQTICILLGIGLQSAIAVYNQREGEDAHSFTTASGSTFDPT